MGSSVFKFSELHGSLFHPNSNINMNTNSPIPNFFVAGSSHLGFSPEDRSHYQEAELPGIIRGTYVGRTTTVFRQFF
jgi:hypothetical protein